MFLTLRPKQLTLCGVDGLRIYVNEWSCLKKRAFDALTYCAAMEYCAQGLLDILDRIEQEFADLIGWDGLDPPENL